MKKAVSHGGVDSAPVTDGIPTEFVPLPSMGKVYDVNSNLHDLEEVEN